ncbi:MAG: type IV pilus assembly protein PilM [Patescibacteria group bacterium]|jgi:type IV pilus assembly protein PilM
MSLFDSKKKAFGLNISDTTLRLIQLDEKGKKTYVQSYNEITLPKGCICGGEINDHKTFLENFNKLIKTRLGHGQLSREIVCSLPESKTFLKFIEFPVCAKEEIKNKIWETLPQHLPMNIEDMYLDWQIINQDTNSIKVLVGASSKPIVDSYIQAIDSVGFVPVILEIEAVAITRLLAESVSDLEPQIIIDIGANRTGLFLYDNNTIKFTVSLPISGNKITNLIKETLDLDLEKAEKAKIVCGLDRNKCHGALLEIFSDTIDELVSSIEKAMSFYYDDFSDARKITKVTLCGGGSNMLGITQVIAEKLGLKVEVSNPWQNIINPNPSYFTTQKSQSFVTALGLGLRGLKPETFL